MSNNNPNNYLAAMPSTVKVGDILVMLSGSGNTFWYKGREIQVTMLTDTEVHYVPLTDENREHRSFNRDQVTAFHVKQPADKQIKFVDSVAEMVSRVAEINSKISELEKERDGVITGLKTHVAGVNAIISSFSVDK